MPRRPDIADHRAILIVVGGVVVVDLIALDDGDVAVGVAVVEVGVGHVHLLDRGHLGHAAVRPVFAEHRRHRGMIDAPAVRTGGVPRRQGKLIDELHVRQR